MNNTINSILIPPQKCSYFCKSLAASCKTLNTIFFSSDHQNVWNRLTFVLFATMFCFETRTALATTITLANYSYIVFDWSAIDFKCVLFRLYSSDHVYCSVNKNIIIIINKLQHAANRVTTRLLNRKFSSTLLVSFSMILFCRKFVGICQNNDFW